MSNPYVGEIRMFGGNFAPVGYLPCNGQLVAISDYDVLFNLLGTTYGGDGQTTFGIPDLQGRVPVHQGQGSGLPNYAVGQAGGSEGVVLTTPQLPSHPHPAGAGGSTTSANPAGNLPGQMPSGSELYAAAGAGAVVPMASGTVGPAGGNQAHPNVMPFQVVNFIIATQGTFPSHS